MYQSFAKLDGRHPWREACPDGYVDYAARTRPGGRVIYFNFDLAKQLGLVPANHAHRLTAALEKAILDAFAIQIINEYDQTSGEPIPQHLIRRNKYMAT